MLQEVSLIDWGRFVPLTVSRIPPFMGMLVGLMLVMEGEIVAGVNSADTFNSPLLAVVLVMLTTGQ
jgi:hypothetical protein